VMLAPAHQAEHLFGMDSINGLSQYLTTAFRDRVATEDDACGNRLRHVRSLLPREASDKFRRSFATADTTLGRFVRRNHLEGVASIGE
jgi:hypothetical protein